LAASAISEINEKSYFPAVPILAAAISSHDSSLARERLATAILHSPRLVNVNSLSKPPSQRLVRSKFFSARQIVSFENENCFIAVDETGTVAKLDASRGNVLHKVNIGPGVWAIAGHEKTKKVVAANANGRVILLDEEGLRVRQIHDTKESLRSVELSSDGKSVILGTESGLHFRDVADLSRASEEPITSHSYDVNAVASADRLGVIWAAETRVFVTGHDKERSTGGVYSGTGAVLSICYNGGSVCFGGEDRTVYSVVSQ
jgi:hypothetical protein